MVRFNFFIVFQAPFLSWSLVLPASRIVNIQTATEGATAGFCEWRKVPVSPPASLCFWPLLASEQMCFTAMTFRSEAPCHISKTTISKKISELIA
jgi:hypothetical protein